MSAPLSLAQHLAALAVRQPAAAALHHGGQTWTFRQLADWAAAAAPPLVALPQAIVGLAADAPALALAAVACSAADRALWPLEPNAPAERRRDWAALGGAAVAWLDALPAAAAPGRHQGFPAPVAADRPALVIGTSGSEGRPKAVVLSHANLDAAAAAANRCLPLNPGDCWLDCLPLYHVGGLAILWRCWRAGATVLLHDGFNAAAVGRDLASRGVTHLSLVPAMLAALLDRGIAPPASLRGVLVGGAALSRPLYDRAQARGWPLLPTYGMSETAAQVATRTPDAGPWREGDVGHPLPGNRLALDAAGRIRIGGHQVMRGYLPPDLAPGLGLDDGWLTSGDLGRIEPDGRLVVLGRADDMLVSGGRNVHPAEVEAGLAGCPGVDDVAVTGLPDPVWGDTVVALVVGPVSDATLRDWSRTHLPGAARPRRIVRLPALPRNAMGKLERQALRALAAGNPP